MAYRYGQRRQQVLFPSSLEEYVSADAPVRAYDAFVEALDVRGLGIEMAEPRVGNAAYDPKAMLKLLVYGYSYGVRSSRKLERETQYNVSFMWLLGGLTPDHKTIAEFRRRHKAALGQVLKQCARLCLKLGLIGGNTLFVDGSKVRANASLDAHWTEDRCRRRLEQIDRRIEEILAECDRVDEAESGSGSWVRMPRELADQQTLRSQVAGMLEQVQASENGAVNATDPECVRVRSRQGYHAGYNLQAVVDDQQGLIVHADVVNENTDLHQLADQLEQAQETLGRSCETVCADAGYANYEELEKVDQQQINVVVPSRRQARRGPAKPFDKAVFVYDREHDVYVCPAGQVLRYRGMEGHQKKIYRAGGGMCRRCGHFGRCATNRKNGRKIVRYGNEAFRERLASQYEQPEAQAIYQRRKQKVELLFGHIKRNLNADHFLLRGLAGVRAEASLLATCFNLARLITLCGVPLLIAQLAT